jgi:acetyl esterase
MTLDPQAQAYLEQVRAAGLPRLYELDAPAARDATGPIGDLIGPGPAVDDVRDISIAVRDAEIPARRYRPAGSRATIVWLHGGGWVIGGGLDPHDAMCRILANSAAATVVSVDYRLAPEHPFPVPLDDCFDALNWVAGREGSSPLVIGGDSAGGNLAAVCALRARDRGGPPLAAQLLVYPVTDTDMTTASYIEHGANELLMLGAAEMAWFFDQYVPEVAQRRNPEVAPLRAPNLSGLPPAIVVVAEYDPLRDDGLCYAERLSSAGVDVTLLRYDDMPHVFFSFVNLIPTGNEAVQRVGSTLRAMIANPAAAGAA